MTRIVLASIATIALAACGGGGAGNNADQLREAAEQSSPEAANMLENAATTIEQQNIQGPAAVQQALEQAGNAQAQGDTAPRPQGMGPGATPNGGTGVGGQSGENPGGANQGGNIEGPGVGAPPGGR